jgi:hypothetical protein
MSIVNPSISPSSRSMLQLSRLDSDLKHYRLSIQAPNGLYKIYPNKSEKMIGSISLGWHRGQMPLPRQAVWMPTNQLA